MHVRQGSVVGSQQSTRHQVLDRFGRVLSSPATGFVALGVVVVVVSPGTDRHQLLEVAAALAFLAAGAGHLLRGRVTGNLTSTRLGLALATLGLQLPASFAVLVLLDAQGAVLARGVHAAAYATAAVLALRAAVPHVRRWLARTLVGSVVAAGTVLTGLLAAPDPATVRAALALGFLGASGLWAGVAVVAARVDPLGDRGRASSRAIAAMAALVAASTTGAAVAQLGDGGGAVPAGLVDGALLTAGVIAAVGAARRITDSLDGQERYVAALIEQLAHHELQLQQTRGCLHDARAALAGIQAGASAAHHPSVRADPVRREQLERATTAEMARLQRLLRMPERTPVIADVDLDVLLDSLVAVHRERGLRIRWSGTGQTPVRADGDALAVIVGNLLGNALVHAADSVVDLEVTVGNELTVSVTDDGPGLSDLQRHSVFEAGARRDGSPGEGIGLALSRDLARRHGGDLVARPAAEGAHFRLTLPVTPVAPCDVRSPGSEGSSPLHGLRLAG
ncbi:HAMP domain-containing sensor histidine kinase [Geodermatophilus sp. Leaf369]|uniref:sensor histidine kinase n=1 Tax=Geodermatophilus sp. Leaf369 TaxID=1736354 RepID=UPI0012FAC6FB|nr:HAMP domain-containing sensor histidine kinase [Geodermatophilus sp. Leaf369]QNG35395.1 HAMP domain-containing histidine kinase [Geodermatophilaceae bacterium NBWT11]